MTTKKLTLVKLPLLAIALIGCSAYTIANDGVASDSTLLDLPPIYGGPGNSVAARGGGDANCNGDYASGVYAVQQRNGPETYPKTGGTPTRTVSVMMTLGGLGTLIPDFDCEIALEGP